MLLAPAVIGLLDLAYLSDRIHAQHGLTVKHIDLPQLLNYSLGFVPIARILGRPFPIHISGSIQMRRFTWGK